MVHGNIDPCSIIKFSSGNMNFPDNQVVAYFDYCNGWLMVVSSDIDSAKLAFCSSETLRF